MAIYQMKGKVCFLFVILTIIVAARQITAGADGYESNSRQSSIRAVPLSRRTTSSSSGRNSRTYLTAGYYRRVRPKTRYSSVSGSRTYVKPTARYIANPRNGTGTDDGRYSSSRYYPPSQKSIYSRIISTSKQLKYIRAEHRRYQREIDRAKKEVKDLQSKCDEYERNATITMQQLDRQKRDFNNYQKETMNKIRQIETHQKSQDFQYFEVFEATSNNTKKISQLQGFLENPNEAYGDIADNIPTEENWNLAPQDLHYQSYGDDDEGRAEEIIERSYQRMSDDIQPQLEEQNIKLERVQESLERQTEDLEVTNSAVRDYRSTLDSAVSVQGNLYSRMNNFNLTLTGFQNSLRSTGLRVSVIEEQNQHQMTAFTTLQHAVSQINESLSRKRFGAVSFNHPMSGTDEARLLLDMIEQVSGSLQNEREKMANLSKSVQSVSDEIRYLTMATSNFYAILTKQAKVIHQQNVSFTPIILKAEHHEHRISDLENDLSYYHETVIKLLNIVTNLGQQIRRPIPQHKDCHDLWMSGHSEDGVYTVVHGMKSKQIYCNMTNNGGWTVIQRRNDGSQDFDQNLQDYKDGFGNIYGEFWLGLDSIRWLTNGRIYTLMVILEDWNGNRRYAFYDKFCVFGKEYALKVSGYRGDAGDSLAVSNQQTFKVRSQTLDGTRVPSSDCTSSYQSGWWFPSSCGEANPNGPYSRSPNESLIMDPMVSVAMPAVQLRYMSWRGEDFPLKKILMQIAPKEAVNENIFQLFSSHENDQTQEEIVEEVVVGETTYTEMPPPPGAFDAPPEEQ